LKHLLCKKGLLPDEFEEEDELKEDAYDLMYGENNAFQLVRNLESSHESMITPAVFNGHSNYTIVQCSKISDAWKSTKKFVKKHKKAIIIGTVIVVAVTAVTVAVVVAGSAAAASSAAGAAGAAASGLGSESSSSSKAESSTLDEAQTSPQETPIFTSAMEVEIASFKESLKQENFFEPTHTGEGLSLEETGRAIGPVFAHDSFNHFNEHFSHYPQLSQEIQDMAAKIHVSMPPGSKSHPVDFGHHEIDRRFGSDIGSMFSNPAQETNFNALSYQMRGEAARSYGYYGQSVNDFTKAISMNPTDPTPYLQRSASYFEMGQYQKSIEDFNHFAAQVEKSPEKIPFSTPEFTLGFAKGLPKGVYESGKGIMLFLGDLVTHPIHTSTQMYDALGTLAKLALEEEWAVIGEVLAPEIHQLATEWDILPSDTRGELAGYAFGKYGADIAIPGAAAKIASRSAKSAKQLTAVLKNLQKAEGTLILETAAGAGNAAQVGEIISNGRKAAFLGEELGFTAKEMGQLKKIGKLEGAIDSACDNLLAKSPSEAYLAAKNGGKHARLLDFEQRSAKEVQKSIKSLEKQIVKHQDKIDNPSKYCSEWDTMDPRRKNALINKRWPAEIQCFTEEKDILQTILEQMIEN